MPKTSKCLKSLKQTCLSNLARNMEKLWCADYSNKMLDQGTYLYLVGPFDHLTPDLMLDLMAVLSEKGLMKTHFLHLLIDSRLEKLDLSQCPAAANKAAVINLISARCKKLKKLNMASCNQVPPRVLVELVAAIPQITVLVMKQTRCSDHVLHQIGKFCVNLRELDVSSCPVSDNGIMNLCIFLNEPTKRSRLVLLNVLSTAVTVKGAEIAIANCNDLRVLMFCDICEVLYRMYGSQEKQKEFELSGEVPSLLLQNLIIQQMTASLAPVAASIEISCKICPNITEVDFVRGVTDQGLVYLSSLEHLRRIKLANCEEQQISFEAGVLPLLQIRGATVEELSLCDINNIDLACIGACCPNIRSLSCLVAGYASCSFPLCTQPEVLNKSASSFTELRHLKLLLHCPQNSLPSTCLKLLFRNSLELETIGLDNIDVLDDDVMNEILDGNPLLKARSIKLKTCQHVTAAPLWRLLEYNELSHMDLSGCLQITRRDIDDFKRYCKTKCFNLKIIWS